MASPIRILTAVPICDGHDSAINTINLEFIRHGIEVIYLGYHRSVGDIVRAAIQEDVRAIGISSYNGGHIEFFAAVVDLLRKKGADDIKVFGGGGGTITHGDAAIMRRKGVDKIFFAGTSLDDMVKLVHRRYGKPRAKRPRAKSLDQELAHKLTKIEDSYAEAENAERQANAEYSAKASKSNIATSKVIGFTGPGGAGKTTLIDELVLRFLNRDPKDADRDFVARPQRGRRRRAAGRSRDHDQFAGRSRFHAQHGHARTSRRAFARDEDCLRCWRKSNFDYVIIETVGTGQEAMPFQKNGIVDQTVLVMNPDYGSAVAVAKNRYARSGRHRGREQERSRARDAPRYTEIEQRLEQNRREPADWSNRGETASRPWRGSVV